MTTDLYLATHRAIRVPQLSDDPDFRETSKWLEGRVGDIWQIACDLTSERAPWIGAADETGEVRFVARPGEWIVVSSSGRIEIKPDGFVQRNMVPIRHAY